MRAAYQSREKRNRRARDLKAEGYKVQKTSVKDELVRPQHVADDEDSHGGARYYDELYLVTWERDYIKGQYCQRQASPLPKCSDNKYKEPAF